MAPAVLGDAPSIALAVYAHPDDADVSCGGVLASWSARGSAVHLVVCTSGDKGSADAATDPRQLVARRAEEVKEAARVLGLASTSFLGVADGELENDTSTRRHLVATIRRLRPEAVLCPDPLAVFFGEGYVNHHDHRAAGWATIDAVAPAAASPLYFPETGPAHQVREVLLSGSLEPNVLIDISGSIDAKVTAILCHRSQIGDSGEWPRAVVLERAREAGRAAGVDYAEAFRRLVLAD